MRARANFDPNRSGLGNNLLMRQLSDMLRVPYQQVGCQQVYPQTVPSNGVPSNGVPSNGVPSNGAMSTGRATQ